jgi:hypothetical protein
MNWDRHHWLRLENAEEVDHFKALYDMDWSIEDEWARFSDVEALSTERLLFLGSQMKKESKINTWGKDLIEKGEIVGKLVTEEKGFDGECDCLLIRRYFPYSESSSLSWFRTYLAEGRCSDYHSFGERPSIIWDCGTLYYHKDGKCHREGNRPARLNVFTGEDGISGNMQWLLNGEPYFPFRHIACLDRLNRIGDILR